jgi:hypothetical protein
MRCSISAAGRRLGLAAGPEAVPLVVPPGVGATGVDVPTDACVDVVGAGGIEHPAATIAAHSRKSAAE